MSAAEDNVREMTTIEMVKEATKNLEDLCTMKIAAANAFSDAVKAVAQKTKMDKTVLASYITARVNDKLEDFNKKQEQMELLFGEIEQ